jgi:hypothetical protein
MPDGHQNPTVEDYISDENGETRRDAGKQPSSTKPMMPHLFHRNHRDAASDSGYSSHTSNTMSSTSHSQPASNFRPPPPPTTQHAPPNHPKPVIGRSESQRHQSRPSRSDSMSKPPPPCTDRHCDDPDCASKRGGGRGYALPLRPQSQQAPQHPQTTQYPVQDTAPYSHPPSHPYAQLPHGQPVPNYSQPPQPRQHASSTSRSRPTSWIQAPGIPIPPYQHGMPPPVNYNAQYHGLQASPSAYGRSYLAHHQSASGDWSGMAAHMASGSPRDPSGLYMPVHGMPIPPNGQAYRPGMTHTYSARQAIPTISSHEPLTPSTERPQPSQPVPSARYRSDMPGSFPGEPSNFGRDSDTSSSSESSDSEEEERHRRTRHQRRRDEKIVQTQRALEAKELMPPPMPPRKPGGRRPTLTHTHTAPAESKRTQSRGPSRHSRHSEPPFPPSEYVDLDRTRPASGKRHTPSYEHIDRHPSLSNHPSSGRHRSGSVLQESNVAQQYVVEDVNGRKTYYDTREEAEAKARRLKQQQHMDAAEAYQATTPALTAETVKRAQQTQQREHRRPASHVSASSRKSTTSSARTGTESIQITRDGTTFSIPTNTTLQIRQTEEGETWVIGSGSPPREHSYYGGSSKSSGSRVGGRRNGSEYGGRRRDTKTEDDGYEPGL